MASATTRPDLITYVAIGNMTGHDQAALALALEVKKRRGTSPDELFADIHLRADRRRVEAQRRERD